ncbi:prefoldin subunit 3-like [Halichondria panicea]|uniref:prefoldin subunit 3-like n=1 Tax=Halichondria panicea TaxID=6063 RepID=UPI00312B31E0
MEVEKELSSTIPEAIFLDDVESFMAKPENPSAEVVIRRFDELYKKYKFMEYNLSQKKKRLRDQIPEIQTSLDTVATLQSKQKEGRLITTNYMLSDSVFATADIPHTDSIMLWLGANVMLEYPIEEGAAMLTQNLSTAKGSLTQVQSELDRVKDQITTIEVDMARVYNWDVQERRKVKATATTPSL